MVLVVTDPKQLFDTDVPVPASYAALDADVLDFFTDTVGKYRRRATAFRIVIKTPADSIAAIEAAGKPTVTIVAVTNTDDYEKVEGHVGCEVQPGDPLIEVS